jgi:diguanylate cyclase (GGDEF)-like protein
MIDIDRSKAINDRHGHDGGDRVIRVVADLLEAGPIAGRIGGEEFAVLMPGHGLGSAGRVAELIRQGCARLRVAGRHGPIPVTRSLNLAAWAEGDTLETLLARADDALYAAKAGGRDRVVSAVGRPLDPVRRDTASAGTTGRPRKASPSNDTGRAPSAPSPHLSESTGPGRARAGRRQAIASLRRRS